MHCPQPSRTIMAIIIITTTATTTTTTTTPTYCLSVCIVRNRPASPPVHRCRGRPCGNTSMTACQSAEDRQSGDRLMDCRYQPYPS